MVYVPRKIARTVPSPTLTAPALPVRAAGTFRELADGAMWAIGKGASLVPGFNPATAITSGSTKTLRFRCRPRAFSIRRKWSLVLIPDPVYADVSAEVNAGSAATTTYILSGRPVPVMYNEDLTARSSVEQEISISVKASGGNLSWEWVECREEDRSALADNSTDYGVRIETISPRAPIFNLAQVSTRGVYDAMANMDARRVGILHNALHTTDAYSTTSASLTAITLLPYKIQVPKLTDGTTTANCLWSVYARMASIGGAGGTVQLTTSVSGVTDSATITGTTFAWIAARTITVACDNFSTADGFRDDELTIKIAGDGTRAIEVASVSIWVDTVA